MQLACASAKSTSIYRVIIYLKCNDIMNTPPMEDGEGDPGTSAAELSASISFGDDEDMAAWANVSAAVTEAVLGTAADDANGEAQTAAAATVMPVPEESMHGQSTKTSVIQGRIETIHNGRAAFFQLNLRSYVKLLQFEVQG